MGEDDTLYVAEGPIIFWFVINIILFVTCLSLLTIFCYFQHLTNGACINDCRKEKPQSFGFLSILCAAFFSLFAIVFSTDILIPWEYGKWERVDGNVSHYIMSMFFFASKSLVYVIFVYRIRQMYALEAKIKYYAVRCWEALLYIFIIVGLVEQGLTPFTLVQTEDSHFYVWNFPNDVNEAEAGMTVIAVSATIVTVLYINQLKKVAKGNAQVRKRTLYGLLKETVLLYISTFVGAVIFIGVAIDDTNDDFNHKMIWLIPLTTMTDVLCVFLLFRMCDRMYFRLCNFCSLNLLRCCGLLERGDDRMLEIAKNTDLDGFDGAARSPVALGAGYSNSSPKRHSFGKNRTSTTTTATATATSQANGNINNSNNASSSALEKAGIGGASKTVSDASDRGYADI